jgi:D-aminopeptidase
MRFRDLGVSVGKLPTGQKNAISDLAGLRVGHTNLIEGDSIRTGVTAILPHEGNLFQERVPAAVFTINGFGKACGFEQVRELGYLETPILLTNTLNVGRVADACIDYTLQQNPNARSVNPLVGECNDSYLNDIQGRHVKAEHVFAALNTASADVAEGNVGAGTGTVCYGFKGGIGTASRIAGDYRLGTLMQTNFGERSELMMLGVPMGQHVPPFRKKDNAGSVMMVIATDAPLTSRQLERLAHRAAFGLGRTGTICHHGSGDFVIAFSTAYRLGESIQTVKLLPDSHLDILFQAVVETIEESVYNALFAAETMHGRDGNQLEALPHETMRQWLSHYRRLGS